MTRIGPYEISRELGQGALAIVHEAYDPKLKRKVALKVLHPIFSRNKSNIDRLRHEAQTLAQLHHPNIIHIYDFLDEEDAKGIVTEYVEGKTLAEFLDSYPVILPEIACVIVAEILAALEHAHSKKIVHRDIKPQNIIINTDGQVKLADFSIAKIMDRECLTLTGQLIGSPFYMSPEQAIGDSVDERSDIFTVGILLYRMVTGELPFFDDDQSVVLKKILNVRFKKPSQYTSKISLELETILLKALHGDKNFRFQKAWEFRYELLKILKDCENICLLDFFKNPKGTEDLFVKQVGQLWLSKGRDAFKKKDFQGASEHWNRILEYDPSNETVQNELANLSKRKRVPYWVGGVLGVVFISFGIWLFNFNRSDISAINNKSTSLKVSSENVPNPKLLENISASNSVIGSGESANKPISKRQIDWAYLEINMDPDTHCYIDGKYIVLDEDNTIRLKPGPHRVRFKKEGFKDIQAMIKLKKGETSRINIAKGS